MENIIYYMIEGIKFLCIYIFGFNMQITAKNKNKVLAGILTVLVGCTIDIWKDGIWYPFLYIGYVLLLSYLLVVEFNWKKVIITMWSMGVIMIVDVISYMLVKLFWIWTGYSDTSLQDIIMSMVTLFILFVVFWLVGRKSKSALSELSWWYYIAFLIICVVNVCVLAILENKLMQRYTEYALVFLLLLIGFIVQMAFVLVLGASNNWHRKNEELKEHYINLQREHYQLLEYKNQEIRKIRHDMRAHLYVMKQYTEQKSWDQLNDYINTIYGKLDSSHSVRSVYNETVDAVLNYYGEKFRNNGCTFRLSGRMPEVCYIDAYDLCTIFSNILSNAFEAVEKVETKWVELSIGFDDENIYISEKNIYNGMYRIDRGKIVTSKKDKQAHGLGLDNIRDSVSKYHGTLNYELLKDEFVLEIIMENGE